MMKHKNHKGIDQNLCFERNNYFYAKLMTVRDFFSEQQYFNEKRWLINRMVNGWGVVAGLDVKPICTKGKVDSTRVLVTPGMALDCYGREILVCEEQEVALDPEEPPCLDEEHSDSEVRKLWICIKYCECNQEPVSLPPTACDGKEKCEYNRIRDSFQFIVKRSLEEAGEPVRECPQFEDKCRPLHDKLCEKVTQKHRDCPEESCLVLAEITITLSEEGNPCIQIDQCSRRKLVYSNSLLYDLIHCYHEDLPHIVCINWKHGVVNPWCDWLAGPLSNGIQITFDQEMIENTINEHTFVVMTKIRTEETGHYVYKQVPGKISYCDKTAIFCINDLCVQKGGDYMVILRGDFIMSDPGDGNPAKALDANFIGGELPSGNGIQGDDFMSWFTVGSPPDSTD